MSEDRRKKKSWINYTHNDWNRLLKEQKQELISEFLEDLKIIQKQESPCDYQFSIKFFLEKWEKRL